MKYSPKRILIVDDDQDVRCTLRNLLEFQEYVCEEADNGESAMVLLCIHHFSLIVTDYQMPRMNGLAFLEELMKIPQYAGIPVIMMTGVFSEEFRDKALKQGAYAVIEKPYSGKEILSSINQALQSSSTLCSWSKFC